MRHINKALLISMLAFFSSLVIAQTEIYYIHNDHLGTPQVVTDQNQNVVWQGEYGPFGELISETGTLEQPIRFPGQYADPETGYYYNYYRDYDPTLGRYVQSDPIGLAGGLNTYSYVGGNPVMYIDPYGLEKGFAGMGINIPFVGGIEIGGFVTDGAGDIGGNADIGVYVEIAKPVDGMIKDSGIGRFRLGPNYGNAPDSGRGEAVEVAGNFTVGVLVNGTVSVSSDSSAKTYSISPGFGYGSEYTINFSLSVGDLSRFLAALASGDFSQNIFGVDPVNCSSK